MASYSQPVFGNIEGTVFDDVNATAHGLAGEPGIPNMIVNLRFRDASLPDFAHRHMGGTFGEVFRSSKVCH
jgi:hypothetical protein